MNPSLVLIFLVVAFTAYSEAYPGMRGNGASGAIRDRDPSNPFLNPEATAQAAAKGDHAKTFTSTQKKEGSLSAFSNASNNGGGPVSASAKAVGK